MLFRCGIIGCGRIGCEFPDNHARAYQKCKDTILTSLWDTDTKKLTEWRDKLGVDGWSRKLDIVSICTPPETHWEVLRQTILTQPELKAIYCEKPIATTLNDADDMIELCHENDIILQVNHQRRFGNPKFLFSRGILNTGTHMFDILRMYFGEIVLDGNKVITPNGLTIDIFELQGDEAVFEFVPPITNLTHPLILKGVEHLVDCINNKRQSCSSGEEAREDLRLCLEYSREVQ